MSEGKVVITEEEVQNAIALAKNETALSNVGEQSAEKTVDTVIHNARQKSLNVLEKDETFNEIVEKQTNAQAQANIVKDEVKLRKQQLENEYGAYEIKKKKEQLDYRVKKEKQLIKQEVQADINDQKYKIALKRYGYLTPLLDTEGRPIKDEQGNIVVDLAKFTPSKTSNRFKEWAYIYGNLSATTRKIITTTLKTAVYGGLIVLGGWLLWKYVLPILQNMPTN